MRKLHFGILVAALSVAAITRPAGQAAADPIPQGWKAYTQWLVDTV